MKRLTIQFDDNAHCNLAKNVFYAQIRDDVTGLDVSADLDYCVRAIIARKWEVDGVTVKTGPSAFNGNEHTTVDIAVGAQSPPAPAPSDASDIDAIDRFQAAIVDMVEARAVGDGDDEHSMARQARTSLLQRLSMLRRPAAPSPAFAELLRAAKDACLRLTTTDVEHDGASPWKCGQIAVDLQAAIAAAKAQGGS